MNHLTWMRSQSSGCSPFARTILVVMVARRVWWVMGVAASLILCPPVLVVQLSLLVVPAVLGTALARSRGLETNPSTQEVRVGLPMS